MSYSFSVRAVTAAAAIAAVGTKFDEVVASQPVHANDRDAAVAAATAYIGLLAEPGADQEIAVTVDGWVQWTHQEGVDPTAFTGAYVNVQASLAAKPASE